MESSIGNVLHAGADAESMAEVGGLTMLLLGLLAALQAEQEGD